MNDTVAIISAIAAVLSALGGAVACIAAFKSAKHAKDTFDAGQMAEKRLLLRQLSVTAHEVSVEVDRIKWVAQGLGRVINQCPLALESQAAERM
jgi:hypothetical protein